MSTMEMDFPVDLLFQQAGGRISYGRLHPHVLCVLNSMCAHMYNMQHEILYRPIMIASPQQFLLVVPLFSQKELICPSQVFTPACWQFYALDIHIKALRAAIQTIYIFSAVSFRFADGSPVLLAFCFSYPVAILGRIVWVSSDDTLTNDQTFVARSLGDESLDCGLG